MFRLTQQLPFISGTFFAWGWSLDLLDVGGQIIERHVPPAFLKWHPCIENIITLTHIFNPLDQVSPNPVLEGPSARFSILPGGSRIHESFVYLVGQKSRPFLRTIMFLSILSWLGVVVVLVWSDWWPWMWNGWVCWPKIRFFLNRLTSLSYRQQYFYKLKMCRKG